MGDFSGGNLNNKKRKNIFVLGILLLAILFLYFYIRRSEANYTFTFTETQMIINGPRNTSAISVDYDDIADLQEIPSYSKGTLVSGLDNNLISYGTFQNEEYGEYTLCATPSIPNAIKIMTQEGHIILFNYESEEVTSRMVEAIQEYMNQLKVK